MNVKELRDRWMVEQPLYHDLTARVMQVLRESLRRKGLYARVTGRVKETASFIKKAMRKGYDDPIERTTDKAGVRVVVQFLDQLVTVESVIRDQFEVLRTDDKLDGLGTDRLGYRSVHYDVQLKHLDSETQRLNGLQCEIQVRTLCQDVFAEMTHVLVYKSEMDLPKDVQRMTNCLGALLEVSDTEFQSISQRIRTLPGANSHRLLSVLEYFFYQYSGEAYDRELSLMVLGHLLPICHDGNIGEAIPRLEEYLTENGEDIEFILSQRKDPVNGIFFSQPEVLLLFYMLDENGPVLVDRWLKRFPVEELESVATAWGKPLNLPE